MIVYRIEQNQKKGCVKIVENLEPDRFLGSRNDALGVFK